MRHVLLATMQVLLQSEVRCNVTHFDSDAGGEGEAGMLLGVSLPAAASPILQCSSLAPLCAQCTAETPAQHWIAMDRTHIDFVACSQ